ncbi:MAG: hypothetical protein ABEJ95_01580 [Candidatus Nanohalobium sp.]
MSSNRDLRFKIKCVGCGAEYWTILVKSKPQRCKECSSRKIHALSKITDAEPKKASADYTPLQEEMDKHDSEWADPMNS